MRVVRVARHAIVESWLRGDEVSLNISALVLIQIDPVYLVMVGDRSIQF